MRCATFRTPWFFTVKNKRDSKKVNPIPFHGLSPNRMKLFIMQGIRLIDKYETKRQILPPSFHDM